MFIEGLEIDLEDLQDLSIFAFSASTIELLIEELTKEKNYVNK